MPKLKYLPIHSNIHTADLLLPHVKPKKKKTKTKQRAVNSPRTKIPKHLPLLLPTKSESPPNPHNHDQHPDPRRRKEFMGMSIVAVAVVSFLHVFAFVLAVGAERRRSTGRVVPDEYDERTFCQYDSDASTAYGLSAFGLLLLSQILVSFSTKCLCCGRGLAGSGGQRVCAIVAFVFSWLSFIVAEACLLAGSAKNAYHTKYVGYYAKRDLESCAALRKGVFAAAGALILVSFLMSLLLFWAHSRADTGWWQKHTNEDGVAMADYKNSQKDEFARP